MTCRCSIGGLAGPPRWPRLRTFYRNADERRPRGCRRTRRWCPAAERQGVRRSAGGPCAKRGANFNPGPEDPWPGRRALRPPRHEPQRVRSAGDPARPPRRRRAPGESGPRRRVGARAGGACAGAWGAAAPTRFLALPHGDHALLLTRTRCSEVTAAGGGASCCGASPALRHRTTPLAGLTAPDILPGARACPTGIGRLGSARRTFESGP
jgi:hypothetical protein